MEVAGGRVVPVETGSLNGLATFTVGADVSDVADSPKIGAVVSDSDELPSVEIFNMETAKDWQ